MIELHIGRQNTGITVVPDAEYPAMWRVCRPGDWRSPMMLSPMMSLPIAKTAAKRMARPRGLGRTEVAYWRNRQAAKSARQPANSGRAPRPTSRRKSPA